MISLIYASIFSFMKDQNTPLVVLFTNVAKEGYRHLAKIEDFDLGNLNASVTI